MQVLNKHLPSVYRKAGMLAGYSTIFSAVQAQVDIGKNTTGRVGAPEEEFGFSLWKWQAGLRFGHNQMANEDLGR